MTKLSKRDSYHIRRRINYTRTAREDHFKQDNEVPI